MERFLSQLLPLLHGNTAAPSLLYGFDALEQLPAVCPASSRGFRVLPAPGRCHRAGEHRSEPGPLSGRGMLAGKVLGWERGASPVSCPGILLLIPLCQSGAWSPRSPGVASVLEPRGELGGGVGGRVRCARTFSIIDNSAVAGSGSGGPYPVASPRQGGSPQHSRPEPLRGARVRPQRGGGERGRVGAILGPSVPGYGRGYGTARRLWFLQQRLT